MTRRRNKQGNGRKERAAGQHRPGKSSPACEGPEADARERLEEMGEAGQVSLSHTSCKSQSCGGGSHSSSSSSSSSSTSSSSISSSSSACHGNSGDWDPSSFLSAHKLSGLWNSQQHSNGSLGGVAAEEKGDILPVSPEHGSKAPRLSGLKKCPYSPSRASTGTLPTSLNFCKSPKQFKSMCHRPSSPGEAYHSIDHHLHPDPSAPPNSPTGLSSQLPPSPQSSSPPHLSSSNPSSPFSTSSHPSNTAAPEATAESPSRGHRGPHLPGSSPSLLKGNPPPPPLSSCSHPCNGHCSGGNVIQGGGIPGTTTNRDTTCRGHKFSNGSSCSAIQPCEADEGLGEDEDSSSERSSCTSSSTNQRDGKFCDCCYCEFFGHNTPPPAPTSRNYPEMREKLRSRLTKRKEEIPLKSHSGGEQAVDHRNVDELLDFINRSESKTTSSNKAAKRARHKLKKKEKALQEAGPLKIDDYSSAITDTGAPASGDKLLQWPQLELEKVNSFLTSRLEEIKNTIKDSIRASFSVYDLNLDVNDFPKKAAVLEQKNLLSHLNGSSDLQEIELDLSPLSLGVPKSQNSRQPEDTVCTAVQPTENGVVKRLSAVPNLSRMIWVQPPKASESGQNMDTSPDTNSLSATDEHELQEPPFSAPAGSRQKKSKKQNLQTRKCGETGQATVPASDGKPQNRTLLEKGEVALRQESDTMTPGKLRPDRDRCEQVGCERTAMPYDMRATTNVTVKESMQPKGKARKSKNRCAISIDDVFLPKDVDSMELDETDREVEYFKRFCLDSAKQTRQKVAVNWTNFSLKKTPSNVAQ
ncbi:protein FAM193B isoform X2 [Xenopus laevis]|uniref:Protein FAM193B isoform X2 n=1 Tax=Xenopus laevis TaxID=8355 RepID=A0A8J1MTE9_XENLA|nr:protein FAM193B isoform X2 [Xenopus laevis]